jgi:soluble lytic murein transglycosylase
LTNSISSSAGKKLNLREEPLLWKSLYPLAFEKDVREQAQKRGISPYLVWAIMKAETQYKQDAISPVGALGLMQFMPYTSQKVALMLQEEHRSEMLFDPAVAVRYGAMYLKKLGDELGGQLPLMAAAYNGGPHRVKLWLRNLKQRDGSNLDFDIFVEHIPFNETRTYTKRVISFYLTYQKLYEEKFNDKTMKWLVEKNPFQPKEPILLKEDWPLDRNVSGQFKR